MSSFFITSFTTQAAEVPKTFFKEFESQGKYETTPGSGYNKHGEIWQKDGKTEMYSISEFGQTSQEQSAKVKELLAKRMPGFYGNAAEMIVGEKFIAISYYKKEFKLIKQATDNVIVAVNKIGNKLVFTGLFGQRTNPPGAGAPALIGGFNDNGIDEKTGADWVDTAFQTALKETREEAGLEILPKPGQNAKIKDPNSRYLDVDLVLGKKRKVVAKMYYCGIQPTGTEPMKDGGERSVDGSSMRVNQAHAVLTITKGVLKEGDNIFSYAKAGDDISKLQQLDITEIVEAATTLENATVVAKRFCQRHGFGINHHADVLARAAVKAHQLFLKPKM